MTEQILKIPESGQKIIDSYLKMIIGGKPIVCPYYTNLKKQRAGLRVFLGKAPAQEIINEAHFISLKKEIDLNKLLEQELYKFLNEHNLGIDCSGLAMHIFQAIYQEKKIHPVKCRFATIQPFLKRAGLFNRVDILKKIKIIPFFKNPWRWFIALLRPIENISVRILANEKNSFLIDDFQKIKPGDMLIRINLRHIYLITKIKKEDNQIKEITYVHAPRPKEKNYFGPGVFQNTILLEKGNLSELSEKINDEIIIQRLKILA